MEVTKSIQFKQLDKAAADRASEILHDIWGIRQVEINVDRKEAVISFNEESASLVDFQQALADGGLEVKSFQM